VVAELAFTTGDRFGRVTDANGHETPAWALERTGAASLAVDPRDTDSIYVGCVGNGVARTRDGARTWEVEVGDLSERDVFSLAVSAADGALYVGTEPSRLFRSRDGGDTFEELTALQKIPSRPSWSFPPRPWTSHVRWVAPSPHEAGRLLVGIELGGLMLSEDGGESFSDHRPEAQPDVHALAWHPHEPGRAYEAGGGGAAWSTDGGRTWERTDEGRDLRYTWGLAVDPEEPDRWYVSAAAGPREAHGGGPSRAAVYRREGGGPWRRIAGPLDAMPYALVALPEGVLFAGLGDGTLMRSDDRGESWEPISAAAERVLALEAVAA
jgi:photosystem II stability/assembly factor-like uncharacterized protein